MIDSLRPEDLDQFLRSMRSVRHFSPTPVPEDDLRGILEVARWTGSAKNTQPWEFVVVRDRNTLRELAGLGQFAGHLAGANFAIAIVLRSRLNQFDAGRVAERLMLGAWSHGVGSCIGSLFPDENETRGKEILGVPAARDMHTAISFGYPADADALFVRRASPTLAAGIPIGRKPLSEIVHLERYTAR